MNSGDDITIHNDSTGAWANYTNNGVSWDAGNYGGTGSGGGSCPTPGHGCNPADP